MGNNSVPKFIFRLSRFPFYRGSVLGRFYCNKFCCLNVIGGLAYDLMTDRFEDANKLSTCI